MSSISYSLYVEVHYQEYRLGMILEYRYKKLYNHVQDSLALGKNSGGKKTYKV